MARFTPEGHVKDRIKKLLSKYPDLWSHWPVQTGFGAPTLDCTGARNGRAFAIEAKAPGQKPTSRQMLTISAMLRGGVTVFVIGMSKTDDPLYPYSEMKWLDKWLSGL